MWIARAVLALLAAAPYTLITTVAPALGEQGHVLSVTIAPPGPTAGQLFFDTGSGYREQDSARVPISAGERRYEFTIPSTTIRGFRLDPGVIGGRYIIKSPEVLRSDGTVVATLSLASLPCLHQIAVIEHDVDRAVLDSPTGSNDPFFCINLPSPLVLQSFTATTSHLVARSVHNWLIGLLVVIGIEQFARRFGSPVATRIRGVRFGNWSPIVTLCISAAIATTAATYPLLFAQRSLVSPGNGPVPMLYGEAPFVPGSGLDELEDTRGSDVWALMVSIVPYSRVQRDALLGGEFPLWMRQNGGGRPLWAQGQTFLLDPLHWLTLIRADSALGWDLKFIAHRFVFSLGVGVAALLATGAVVPSAMAAALTPFAGLYAFRFNHPAAFTPSYASWILVAWFLMVKASTWRTRWGATLLLALATSLTLVSSPPKEALMMIAGCHLTGAIALVATRMSNRERFFALVAAAGGGLITALATTPHWLVFLDTLQAARTAYDSPVVHLATLDSALGFVLGNLTPAALQPGLHPLAVALALCAILRPSYLLAHRGMLACALGALCLTAVAFGAIPVSWLLRVPLINNIAHFGDVMMTALMVPTAVLAAGGVAALYQAGRVSTTVCTVGLLCAAAAVFHETRALTTFGQFEQWVRANVVLVAICTPVTIAGVGRYRERTLPKLAVFAILVVLSGLGGLHLTTDKIYLDKWLQQPAQRVNLATNSPAIQSAPFGASPTRVVGLGFMMLHGTQALYGLEGIGGPDPLVMGPYEELVDGAGVRRDLIWLTLVTPDRLDQMGPLLDLLNVGFVITPPNQLAAGLVTVGDDPDPWIDIARRPGAWPRAFFVDGVRTYTTPADLLDLVREERAPFAGIQADDLQSQRFTDHLPNRERTMSTATDYILRANSTSFRIRANSAGVAVLTESYLKDDFRATLNGTPVPYFRVNHAFKGVSIPSAGVWDVTFAYRPRHWTIAWMCAAIGMLLAVLLGTWSMRCHRTLLDIRQSKPQ